MKKTSIIYLLLSLLISMCSCSQYKLSEKAFNNDSSTSVSQKSNSNAASVSSEDSLSDEVISMVTSELTVASIKSDNSLWMYGNNDYGQIGNGTTERVASFERIMSDVTFVSLDRYCSAAIKSDNSLWVWGQNRYGQFGDLTMGNDKFEEKFMIQTEPIKIMDNVSFVSVGESNIAIIKTDGSLWISGLNCYGQIGIGTISNAEPFTRVMDDVKFVGFGDGNVVAIKNDRSLWTWGINAAATLGNGQNGNLNEYQTFTNKILDNVLAVKCAGFWGFQNTVAILDDNSLYAWGADQYGQVGSSQNGNGSDAWNRTAQNIPLEVLKDIMDVSITRVFNNNYTITFALNKYGVLYSWGLNDNGQVGNGTKDNVSIPFKVMENVRQAAVQGTVACSLQNDGSLWVWGNYIANQDAVTTPTKISEDIKSFYITRQKDIFVVKSDGLLYQYKPSQKAFQRVFE